MNARKKIKKVGLVVMGNISEGGGYPRVIYDLIIVLNSLEKEVYLLTPFRLDYDKINDLYGPIKIKKIYNPKKLKSIFMVEDVFRRKLMKKEFKEMASEVDFIIDICGRVMDKYIPKKFYRNNYIVWAITSLGRGELQFFKNFKRNFKEIIRAFLKWEKDLPAKDIKIYALDEWTKNDIINKSKLSPEKECLYPAIQVKELLYKRNKKKNQIIINGRINPVKRIEESIKIFYNGTKNYPHYKLLIIGGVSHESEEYINYLKKLIGSLKIENRVSIIKNPSFEMIKKELLDSKVLIDSQKGANLTMTAIEGMAAGCIILAPKNGGTYTEILENGKDGYGFESVNEGAKILSNILNKIDEGKLDNYKSIQRSKFFSKEMFVNRIKKILGEK